MPSTRTRIRRSLTALSRGVRARLQDDEPAHGVSHQGAEPRLLHGGQVGARPLRVDDELEGIQLLVPRAEPVEGTTPKIGQR